MAAAIVELSSDQLVEKLTEVLEKWPIYRRLTYGGKQGHHVERNSYGQTTYSVLPKRLSLFCTNEKCQKIQLWEASDPRVNFTAGFKYETYTCRNCGRSAVTYFFRWSESTNGGIFFKVGQYPPLGHEPPAELAARLDADDREFYKKALDSRNFAYGLGALAYLRRVVENRTNDLLDLIETTARQEGAGSEILAEIEAAKKSKRYEDKLDVASKAIPARLKPDGSNPIGSLYKLASAGIHQESEEECLEIFDSAKLAFEYLFSQLEHEQHSAKDYVASLKALREKATKAGVAAAAGSPNLAPS